jgi:hypothetical protein
MGEQLTSEERALFKQLTGREHEPGQRVDELVLVVGRKGGKTRTMAALAVYLAALCDYRSVLAAGERGVVLCVAQSQAIAKVLLRYAEGILRQSPLLGSLIVNSTQDAIELSNGLTIEVRPCNYKSLRGPTYIAALADEAAFWFVDAEAANPDTEVIAAIRPALGLTRGLLTIASSPYARKGLLWERYRRHYGADGNPLILVAQGGTRDFNPLYPQATIDAALSEDHARNAAEYLAQFRTDVEGFVAREAVEACVSWDVRERPPMGGISYYAFADPSGGSADSMTLAIGHRENDVVIIDALRERRPPFSPEDVVAEFCELLRAYGVTRITGDRYAGEWPRERFMQHGVTYEPAARPKSDLYRDLLPLVNSRRLDLLDDPRLLTQLVGLERRTARGGRDSIDHAPGGHDDVANAVAGLAASAGFGKYRYDGSLDWVSGPTNPTDSASAAEEFQRQRLSAHILRYGQWR